MIRHPPRSTLFPSTPPFRPPAMTEPLLRVKNLKKYFPIRGGLLSREIARVHAVDNVSFEIMPGETLGMISNDTLSTARSEEHTSELQSRLHLVCRLLLEKKK